MAPRKTKRPTEAPAPEPETTTVEVGGVLYAVPKPLFDMFGEVSRELAERLRNTGTVLGGFYVGDKDLIDRMTLSAAFHPELWNSPTEQCGRAMKIATWWDFDTRFGWRPWSWRTDDGFASLEVGWFTLRVFWNFDRWDRVALDWRNHRGR